MTRWEGKYRNKYRMASTRLQDRDYGSNGAYFVTLCTKDRIRYFGDIFHDIMRLTVIGEIAGKYWREIQNHFPFVKLGEFVIMPNHLHGIVVIDKEGLHDNTSRVGNESYTGSNMGSCADVETRQCLVSTKILPLSSSTIPTTASTMKPAMGRCIGQNRFQNQGKNTLSSVIGSYKSMVTKHARHINPDFAWQGRFYDHIIRDDAGYVKISEYIINNPVNWEQDKEYNG